jgi:subfamily B ATP-binding cassette protein MsbA
MKTYFRILAYARPFGWFAPQYLLYTLLYVVFGVLNLVMVIPMLEIILNNVEVTASVMPEFEVSIKYFKELFKYYFENEIATSGKSSAILLVISILMSSVLLSNFFGYLSNLILAKLRVNLITNLRTRFYESMSNLDLGYFSDKNRGDLMARGTADMLQVENSVINTLKVLIKDPLMIVGLFVALFTISPTLTLYSLTVLPFAGILISYLGRRLKKRATRSQESVGKINTVLDETLLGMRVIKAFVAETYMNSKFVDEVKRYGRHVFGLAKKQNLIQPSSEVIGIGAACVVIFMGSHQIFNGTLEPQVFLGFLLMFTQLLPPAKAFAGAFSNVQRGIAAGERVFEIIDSKYEIREPENPIFSEGIRHELRFENVSFAYAERHVLKNIDFTLPKGKIVALVGPSGGGKSTIADLIPRFYDPKDGRLLLDGTDLRDYAVSSVRGMIGVVTQESILFNDTIRNNITFGKDATDEEVMAAAKTANAHEFIVKLENGYDTSIGDRGTKLSGGQRQRISIARALLRNPPILILDEATSALDSESEKLVQEAIYNLMQNRTTLVIAHRLSTIQHADEILVIKDGEIIQRGNHDALMLEGGLYKKLTKMQSF